MNEVVRQGLAVLAKHCLEKRFGRINIFDESKVFPGGILNIENRTELARLEFVFNAVAFVSLKEAEDIFKDACFEMISEHSNAIVIRFLEKTLIDGNVELAFQILNTLTQG